MVYLTKILQESLLLLGIEQNTTSHLEKVISALGAFLGIAAVYGVSHWYLDQQGALLMVASMGATAVLLFAVPHGALSQPWPVVAGHLVSAFIGIVCAKLFGVTIWSPALAVGLAVGAMYYLRCIHPPGGATALTAVIGGNAVQALGFELLVFPVLLNLAAILAVAIIFNSPFKWRRYPGHFANRRAQVAEPTDYGINLTHEDFAAAMQELNSLIDVTPDDLARLFEFAASHSQKNIAHPGVVVAGCFYSNGRLGKRWSIRQVIDASEASGRSPGKVIYKVLAGDGAYETGICPQDEFRQWASFEVVPSNGHWLRVDSSDNENPVDSTAVNFN